MQRHKRLMYTFLLASKYFTRTFTFAASRLSYCTEHNTKQDQSRQLWAANLRSLDLRRVCRNSVQQFLFSGSFLIVFFFFFVSSFPLWLRLFGAFVRLLFSVLFSGRRRLDAAHVLSPGLCCSLTESYRFLSSGDWKVQRGKAVGVRSSF